MLLSIAVCMFLFVWGMQDEKLGWKPFATMAAIATVRTALSLASGSVTAESGAGVAGNALILFGVEMIISAIAFFIGFGVGKFRRRDQAAQDDSVDTFS